MSNMGRIFMILLAVGLLSCAEQVEISLGGSRAIEPDMIGLNGNLTGLDAPWKENGFVNAIQTIGTTNFRYPAGTLGNYWDWDRGWLDPNVPDSLMIKWVVEHGLVDSPKRYTLENLKEGYEKTGFTPVFMLNMLSKDLGHSIRNLKRAESLGLPIKYIEMGNELYFNLPLEMAKYPTPEDYGRTCKEWIDSLKVHWPDAKYAVIGSYIKRKPRHIDWTKRVLQYCDNADAVTFHKYSPSGIDGKQENKRITAGTEGKTDASTATRNRTFETLNYRQEWELTLLRDPAAYANFLNSSISSANYYHDMGAPEGMDIWATEFNMRADESVLRGTWANAFNTAKYYEVFLASPVTLTNIHNAIGDLFAQIYDNKNRLDHVSIERLETEPWTLSSQGIATAMFAKASAGMNNVSFVEFSSTEITKDDRGNEVELLCGWQFEGNAGKRMLIINYGYDPIKISGDLLEEFKVANQHYAELETYVTNGFNSVDNEEVLVDQDYKLNPHSFTLFEAI